MSTPAQNQYALAEVGRGRATHILDPNQRTRCENAGLRTWLTRDPNGMYQDKTLLSKVRPLGRSGQPTCRYCKQAISA